MGTRRVLSFVNLKFQQWKLERWARGLPVKKRALVRDALAIAQSAHRGQRRDDGGPYIIHPVRVANVLIFELGLHDADLVMAALLHDVIEDSAVTSIARIRKAFGSRVARLVHNNTRARPEHETEAQKRMNKPKKLRETMRADRDTRLVKCADILDNMRSWSWIPSAHPSRKKFRRWLDEAEAFYLPLAAKTDTQLLKETSEAYRLAQAIYHQQRHRRMRRVRRA